MDQTVYEIPSLPPARALKRLCAVVRSATPEIAGEIRTKASSSTHLLFNVNKNATNLSHDS